MPGAGGNPDPGAGGTTGLSNGGTGEPGGTTGEAGAPAVLPSYACVLEPKTHLELINACTDAVRIEKQPELPAIL